jgi:hypothetical protein
MLVYIKALMPSSVISAMQYNPKDATLRIVYVSGMVYDYLDVPEKIYQAMKRASSKGTYLNKHIKGYFSFKKIS